jgi:hypothetical protein
MNPFAHRVRHPVANRRYEAFSGSGPKLLPERVLHDGAPNGVANPVADRVCDALTEPLGHAPLDGVAEALADHLSHALGFEPAVGALHNSVTQLLSKSLAHCFPDPLAHHLFEAIACGFRHRAPHGFVDALAHRLQQALAGVAERLAAKARATWEVAPIAV